MKKRYFKIKKIIITIHFKNFALKKFSYQKNIFKFLKIIKFQYNLT
jgi:hypothetical protein